MQDLKESSVPAVAFHRVWRLLDQAVQRMRKTTTILILSLLNAILTWMQSKFSDLPANSVTNYKGRMYFIRYYD